MRCAILADVHGNLEALEAVLADIDNRRIDKLFFVGDIVGYGADPQSCIELLANIANICVAGNHDRAAVGLTDISYFNPAAKQAVLWTKSQLNEPHKEYLRGLNLTVVSIDNIRLVHGSPYEPQNWHYIFSENEAALNFNYFNEQICFIGHSHRPAIFIQNTDKKCSKHTDNRIKLQAGCKYIINVGSVGQPRDNNPKSCYGIYDDLNKEVELIRTAYDINKAQQKIIDAGLPEFLARRLKIGY